MKKAITILAVLIVLVGAVFAEDHTIRIKADVTSVIPVFALKYDNVTTGAGDTAITNETTRETTTDKTSADYGQYTNRYTDNGEYIAADGTVLANTDAVTTGLKLDKGGDVYFNAMLLNPAKQKKGYTLEFKGGVFTATINSGAETVTITPTITRNSMNTTTSNGFAVSAGADTYKVRVVFDGKQVVNNDSINLATAKYAYAATPQIDMPAGTENYYYADVTLTITADAN